MTKKVFGKIAAGLREAADVAAIIAERDAAIRERDEARAIIRETLWMARRYADGRGTYATSSYNAAARKALASGIVEASSGNDEPIWASDMAGAGYAGLSQEEHDAALAYRARRADGRGDDERRAEIARARAEALEEAATAATRAAWKHEGDDDYSRGMDRGAREQVEACAAAIRALKEAKG